MAQYSHFHNTPELPLTHEFRLVLPYKQMLRLQETCFRGICISLAGNLMRWDSFRSLVRNRSIRSLIAEACRDVLEGGSDHERDFFGPISTRFTIQCPFPIGWTSAVTEEDEFLDVSAVTFDERGNEKEGPGFSNLNLIDDRELEMFSPNRRTKALRFRLDSGVFAPLTKLLTFVVNFHFNEWEGYWVGMIQTIYPGKDIGSLTPTRRSRKGKPGLMRGVVFFDWNHPGVTYHHWGPNVPLKPEAETH